jgi:hypothetical protein
MWELDLNDIRANHLVKITLLTNILNPTLRMLIHGVKYEIIKEDTSIIAIG